MKVIYRGDCDELYGRELEYPDHDCIAHVSWKESDWIETHGLDCGPYEHCHDEWWECAICHQRWESIEEVPSAMDEETNGLPAE